MVFVPSNKRRGERPHPSDTDEKEYRQLCRDSLTIADIAKFKGCHESLLRVYLKKNILDLVPLFADNQQARYKALKEANKKGKKIPKEKPEPMPKHMAMSDWYKKAIKTYRYCVTCPICELLLAHMKAEDEEIPERLVVCPVCGHATVKEDVNLDFYRKCIRLKQNHRTTEKNGELDD